MSIPAPARPADRSSIVNPVQLTHGTLMCRDMAATRRFYEEFLGLEVVRHAKPAMMLRLASNMYVVCVCIGDRLPNQHVLTHWGVNVVSREEVTRAHAAALEQKETYGIRRVHPPRDFHGAYAFYLQDLDFNWWEIQYEPRSIDDFFGAGDRFDMSTVSVETAESHE